ncbi:MAG: SprB repeat-containing protein, partial [Flavobacteriaceae bacterium]|nr:SprB repeat-containing protein [Flavobacteriaceae bacterium]
MRKLVRILFLLVVSVSFSQQVQIYYDLHLTVGFVPSGALTTQIQGPCTLLDEVYMDSDVTLRGSSLCSDSLPYVFYIGLTRENSSGADDEGYVTINSVGESKSIHLEVNDGGAIHSLDVTFYVLDMMSLQDPVKLSCEEIQINATQGHPLEAYNWQFQALSDQWQDVLIQQNQDNITVSLNDLYGANANSYLNTPINFRIHNQFNNYYSNTKSYVFTDCSPGLVQDPPTAIPPTCSDSGDGSVQIQFDRSLAINERMLVYVENQETDGTWSTYGNSYILDATDINSANSNTYVWDPILVPNIYRLRYVSKYDVATIDPTPDPANPNSDEMSQPFTVTAPAPVALTYSKEDVLCHGANTGSITITASGGTGSGYEYSIDNGTTWQSSNLFSGLTGDTTYNLLVQDSNGCMLQTAVPVFIDEPDLAFTIQALNIVNPTANGATDGSISLFITGGTGDKTYTWLKDGVTYSTTTISELTGLGAGNYEVTGVDDNGCSSNTLTIPLVDPLPLSIDFTVVQAIDCNGNTGSIRAQGVGGNGTSYTYTWQNGTTGQDLLNIPAGTYTVTVTDANSVSVTDSFELTQPEVMNVSASKTDVSCFGSSDGSLSLTISGGVVPYSITWTDDNSVTTTNRTNLSHGDYYYTVTDANGCTISGSVSITQPPEVEIIIDNVVNPTIVGGSDGSIEVSVSGGTPGYTYKWT